MVDTSRFGAPATQEKSVDTSRFGAPKQKAEAPGLGSEIYGGAVGLASSLLGTPGDIQSLNTET